MSLSSVYTFFILTCACCRMLERWRLDGPSRRTVAKDRLGLQGRLTYASPPLDVVWEFLIQVYSLHVTRLFLSVFVLLFSLCFLFWF
jgi:hypothetical protein